MGHTDYLSVLSDSEILQCLCKKHLKRINSEEDDHFTQIYAQFLDWQYVT